MVAGAYGRYLAQRFAHKVQAILAKEQLVADKHAGSTEYAALDGVLGVVLEGGLDVVFIGQREDFFGIKTMLSQHRGYHGRVSQVTALYPKGAEQAVDEI